ncbi:MAG: hypothetical protein D6736_02820 [Nitrospinota bacterium]|nr:MAG: hypothetical protein D6736_02820 [Nitrospinota bacterium]
MPLSIPEGGERIEKLMGIAMPEVLPVLERVMASLDLPYRVVEVNEEERHLVADLPAPSQLVLQVRRMPEARVGGRIRLPRTRLVVLLRGDEALRQEFFRQLAWAFLRAGG